MASLVLFGSLAFAFLIGMPIAFALGFSSLCAMYYAGGVTPILIMQKMFAANDSFPLMAIPFFVLAGGIMTQGGISRRLVDVANLVVGRLRIPGGLAVVAVLGSVFFGAISGSPVATVAAVGGIVIPSMVKNGYSRPFCGAVQAAAGPLGALIPPSIGLIIYGVSANQSISDLFIATIGPGLLMGFGLMITSGLIAKKRGFGVIDVASLPNPLQALKQASWALFMPVLILGGIYGGWCTPTEAAVLAVAYGYLIGTFVYRELKFSMYKAVLLDTVIGTALIMIIIAFSTVFSTFMVGKGIPQLVATTLLELTDNKFLIMLILNIMLLVIGTFMDLAPAVVILVPILMPLMDKLGYDPIHFGIIVTTNLLIGLVTPPVGICLFMASRISGAKIDAIIKELWPLIFTMIAVLAVVNFFPQLSLFLLGVLGSR